MKRKLFSTLLCAVALLLLMGAGVENADAADVMVKEESTRQIQDGQVLETGEESGEELNADAPETQGEDETEAEQESELTPVVPAVELDANFLIDGQPVPADTARMMKNGVTYVALTPTVKALAPEAQITWNSWTRTAEVQTGALKLTAQAGQFYAVANGRYLYAKDGILMQNNRVMIPLAVLTEAFGATHTWDSATNTVRVTRGTGALVPAESYYNQNDLFWLSRIIHAESGNQPLKGKMAVGNVVMNRVASPRFPNSVQAVLAQKNQFTTYRGGKLANRTPNEGSVIAAKLVLDGGVVEEVRGALYFDSLTRSWASRQRIFLGKIGGHSFYR